MTTTTTTRANRYPGSCIRCRGHIAAGAGLLARTPTGWGVDHDGPCPTAPAPAAADVLRVSTDGIYRNADGAIFKVQEARQGNGRLYAKRLTISRCADRDHCGHPTLVDGNGDHHHGHFNYEAGAINTLTADMKLDEHDARVFGRLYGICVACGADLTDETSIAAGIGPVCGKRF